MPDTLEKVEALYRAYVDEFHQSERNRKPLEGAFGFGGGPQSYPCHERFVQDLELLLRDFAAQAPDSSQVSQILNYICLTAPARWETGSAADWMLLAAHSLTLELIPLLSASDAGSLYAAYQAAYPRRRRLPVQNKLLAALKAASG